MQAIHKAANSVVVDDLQRLKLATNALATSPLNEEKPISLFNLLPRHSRTLSITQQRNGTLLKSAQSPKQRDFLGGNPLSEEFQSIQVASFRNLHDEDGINLTDEAEQDLSDASNTSDTSEENIASYLDLLPEANPIIKRTSAIGQPDLVRSLFPLPSESTDSNSVLTAAYLAEFLFSATDISQLLDNKEPLAPSQHLLDRYYGQVPSSKKPQAKQSRMQQQQYQQQQQQQIPSQQQQTYSQQHQQPPLSVSSLPINGSNLIRSALLGIIQNEQRVVYLKHVNNFTNTIKCSQTQLNALKNGEYLPVGNDQQKLDDALNDRIQSQLHEEASSCEYSFDSAFESGNLSIATRIVPLDAGATSIPSFNLILQNDINTTGYTQWFFFRVHNTHAKSSISFNLLNFYKTGSLFSDGMKVSVFSKRRFEQERIGWFKGGKDISYTKNAILKSTEQSFYTLSFSYTFRYADDDVYFAYNIPYTYTQLNKFLSRCIEDPTKTSLLKRKTLCRTLAGNKLDLVSITNPAPSESVSKSSAPRKGIVITARAHPGETVSSHIMQGVIEQLLDSSPEAQFLREKFVFKIIPMLNPDGVIHGNYRCSLSGNDLNRRWKNPSQRMHPEIYFTKQMIFDFNQKHPIAMAIDIHGHSRKMNVFAYGCHDQNAPFACREYPFILSKLTSAFSFNDCNFVVQKNREGTARIALYKSLGIPNIFTVESSFCGPSADSSHFNQFHLRSIGSSICQALIMKFEWKSYQEYVGSTKSSDNNSTTSHANLFNETSSQQGNNKLASLHAQRTFLDELYEKPDLLSVGMSQDDSGSDSDPSADNLSESELKRIFNTKKKNTKPSSKQPSISANLTANIPTASATTTTTTAITTNPPRTRNSQQGLMQNPSRKDAIIPPTSSQTSTINVEYKGNISSNDASGILSDRDRPRTAAKIKPTPKQLRQDYMKSKDCSSKCPKNSLASSISMAQKVQLATMKNMVALEPKSVNFPVRVTAPESPWPFSSRLANNRFSNYANHHHPQYLLVQAHTFQFQDQFSNKQQQQQQRQQNKNAESTNRPSRNGRQQQTYQQQNNQQYVPKYNLDVPLNKFEWSSLGQPQIESQIITSQQQEQQHNDTKLVRLLQLKGIHRHRSRVSQSQELQDKFFVQTTQTPGALSASRQLRQAIGRVSVSACGSRQNSSSNSNRPRQSDIIQVTMNADKKGIIQSYIQDAETHKAAMQWNIAASCQTEAVRQPKRPIHSDTQADNPVIRLAARGSLKDERVKPSTAYHTSRRAASVHDGNINLTNSGSGDSSTSRQTRFLRNPSIFMNAKNPLNNFQQTFFLSDTFGS